MDCLTNSIYQTAELVYNYLISPPLNLLKGMWNGCVVSYIKYFESIPYLNQIMTIFKTSTSDLRTAPQISMEKIKSNKEDFLGFDRRMTDTYIIDKMRELEEKHGERVFSTIICRDPKEYSKTKTEEFLNDSFEQVFLGIDDNPKANLICIPILSGAHYTGFVIDRKNQSFILFNSLKHGDSYRDWEQQVRDMLLKKYKEFGQFTEMTNHSHFQEEGWSCGYRLLQFFKEYCKGICLEDFEAEPKEREEAKIAHSINKYVAYLQKEQSKLPTGCHPFYLNLSTLPLDVIISSVSNNLRNLNGEVVHDSAIKETIITSLIYLQKNKLIHPFIKCLEISFSREQKLVNVLNENRIDREQLVAEFFASFLEIKGRRLDEF